MIGHHILTCIHKSVTAKALLSIPTKRDLVTHSPYTLPKYVLLDLPCVAICSAARFRLQVRTHTLRIETDLDSQYLPCL